MRADLLLLVLLLAGVPVAVITTVILGSLTAARRRRPPPGGPADVTGRQALAAAWHAHARLAALEDRVRGLERHATANDRRGGPA
jgi:hypothetical protein